jgi:phosphoglycolate phosphatase
MKYKGIIFDLDGTLAYTLTDIAGSMNRVLKDHGYPAHPVEDYKLLVGRGLDKLVKQALPVYSLQPAIVSECISELVADYSQNCLISTCLYDGIRELLIELSTRGLKLAVFSNKVEALTQKIINHLLPDIQFERVMGARPDFPKKPDPAGALLISEQTGIPPVNMIYMGDSDIDMLTALHAGMYAVGVLWGFRSGDELLANGAKMLLKHPLDLPELLLNKKKINN